MPLFYLLANQAAAIGALFLAGWAITRGANNQKVLMPSRAVGHITV
jgi:hypothetical protein